jgi:hypothetical protein
MWASTARRLRDFRAAGGPWRSAGSGWCPRRSGCSWPCPTVTWATTGDHGSVCASTFHRLLLSFAGFRDPTGLRRNTQRCGSRPVGPVSHPYATPEGSVAEIITAMRRGKLALALVGLTTGGIVAGCVAYRDSWVGEVMTLSPRLCVGRHNAAGTCFIAKSPQILTTLHIGECVEVSFTPSQDVAGHHF